jgi:protein kinase X
MDKKSNASSKSVEVKSKVLLSEFEFIKTIGTGSFGRVKLARHKKTNKIYAIKMLKKAEIIKLKQMDHIYSEYTILSMLNHPFIVELKGISVADPKFLHFVLEYIAGGELFMILRTQGCFPLEQSK